MAKAFKNPPTFKKQTKNQNLARIEEQLKEKMKNKLRKVIRGQTPTAQKWRRGMIAQGDESFICRTRETIENFLDDVFCDIGISSLEIFQTWSQDDYIDLIEDILILITGLVRSKNIGDMTLSVITYIKLRCKNAVLTKQRLKTTLKYLDDVFAEDLVAQADEDSVEDIFSTLRGGFECMDNIVHLPIYQKMYRFVMYCLAQSVFSQIGLTMDTMGYSIMEQEALKKKYYLGLDFYKTIADTLLFICERGYQCYKLKSPVPMMYCESAYETWYADVTELKRKFQFISNPKPHGFTHQEFTTQLDSTIEKGQGIYKYLMAKNSPDRTIVIRFVGELQFIRSQEIASSDASAQRKMPYTVLVFGTSSIAKTAFSKVIMTHYGRIHNLPTDDKYIYNRNSAEDHYNGFKSHMWGMYFDEVGKHLPQACNGVDPMVSEVLGVGNNQSMMANMASLDEKGRCPIKTECLVATTNVKSMNAEAFMTMPLAAQRRMRLTVTLTVKEEYRREGSLMINEDLLPPLQENTYPDWWNILVQKAVPKSKLPDEKRAKYETLGEFSCMQDFLQFLNEDMSVHEKNQMSAMNCVKSISNVMLCSCKLPKSWCVCPLEAQADEMNPADFGIRERLDRWKIIEIFHSIFFDRFLWFSLYVIMSIPFLRGCFIILDARYHFVHRMMEYIKPKFWLAFWKLFWHDDRLERRRRKRLAIIAASITTTSFMMWGACEILKMIRTPVIGNIETPVEAQATEGFAPVPLQQERENVWKRDDYEVTDFDFSRQSISAKNNIPIFEERVSRNVVRLELHNSTIGKTIRVNAFCVGGNVYISTNHCFYNEGNFDVKFTHAPIVDGLSQNTTFILTQKNIHRYPERDTCAFVVRAVPPKVKLDRYFVSSTFRGSVDSKMFTRDPEGQVVNKFLFQVSKQYCDNTTLQGKYRVENQDMWKGYTRSATVRGECGSPYVSTTSCGFVILGLHCIGQDHPNYDSGYNIAAATNVTIDLVEKIIRDCTSLVDYIGDNAIALDTQGYERDLIPLSDRSPLRFIRAGVVNCYGSLKGFRAAPKSLVTQTIMCDSVKKNMGFEPTHAAPVMKGWRPWYENIDQMVTATRLMDPDMLEFSAMDFYSDIITALSPRSLEMLHTYDHMTTINGFPGVAYVDKINRNTSAGFPYKRSKREFLLESCSDIYPDGVDILDSIKTRIAMAEQCYAEGTRSKFVFTGSLKDEARQFKKIKSCQTRLFCGSSIEATYIGRKYFLSMCRLIANNKLVFETAVGTVAQSSEWQTIRDYFPWHANMVAGDFKNFDKNMQPEELWWAFWIIIKLYESAGATDEDQKIRWAYAHDVMYAVVDLNGDLVEFFGTNPSGQILTVIINGLVHSNRMRYIFYIIYTVSTKFKDFVKLVTYGDDGGMSVNPTKIKFNHCTIQAELGKIGIRYTMADKDEKSVPYIHMDQMTFLKRSWRFDDDMGYYLAPISFTSISKALTVWRTSRSITPKQQAAAALEWANSEFFYHGRKIFDERRKQIQKVIEECDLHLQFEISPLSTWNDLRQRFLDHSIKIRMGQVDIIFKEQEIATGFGFNPISLACQADEINHGILDLYTLKKDQNLLVSSNQRLDCNMISSVKTRGCPSCGRGDRCASVRKQKQVKKRVWFYPKTPRVVKLPPQIGSLVAQADEESLEVTKFNDEDNSDIIDISTYMDSVALADFTPAVDLNEFLKRPIRINTFTWTNATVVGSNTFFYPWMMFLNNPAVKKKIDNYSYLRCTLHLKFVVDASPFTYGAMAAVYTPVHAYTESLITNSGLDDHLMPESQKPHIWLFPDSCQGGEIHLPFFLHKNYIELGLINEAINMGRIDLIPFTELRSCNGVAVQTIPIHVYAWADNISLSGPSVTLSAQADEYESKGPVSKTASAVASVAKKLESVPVIGQFAKATNVVATSIASVASFFGFTNVPNIETVCALTVKRVPNIATTDISAPIEKLTLDSKNELTIDPRTVGLGATDELLISYIAGRESWFLSLDWLTSAGLDSILMSLRVAPHLANFVSQFNAPVNIVPVGYITQPFLYWRGDLIYRFRVVCTKYHKGRLRISYDPTGTVTDNQNNTPANENKIFNRIVDISTERDIEIRVPYCQCTAYLRTDDPEILHTVGGGVQLHNPVTDNGTLMIRVLNELSTPTEAGDVRIMCFIRGADNFEVACPKEFDWNQSVFSAQADESDDIVPAGTNGGDDKMNLVYQGEKIVSMRQLLHRACLSEIIVHPNGYAINQKAFMHHTMPRFPKYNGFNTLQGETPSVGIVVPASTFNATASKMTFMTWLAPLFLAYRGSINWTFIPNDRGFGGGSGSCGQFTVTRSRDARLGASLNNTTAISVTGTTVASVALRLLNLSGGTEQGASITQGVTSQTIMVNVPDQNRFKFRYVSPTTTITGNGVDDTDVDSVVYDWYFQDAAINSTDKNVVFKYCAAGPDFNFFWFLRVPTIYRYSVDMNGV
jgi:hypothetical protein